MGFESDVDAAKLPAYLAECLRRVKANDVQVQGNYISFKGGVLRWVTNWNVLVPFGFGNLSIDPASRSLRYRLSLRQLGIVVTVQVVFFGLILAHAGIDLFLLAPLAWVVLVGLNLAIAIPRFESFLRRAIKEAPRQG